ncbi:MAG: bile acid:sodium symporter family protein [Gammaproteobacteria bacterium]|nr:bile acid:sodium symporter family protein [Gammaproteobacteria bacterium]
MGKTIPFSLVEAGIPIQVLLPMVVAAMMLAVGMSLRAADFAALPRAPQAAAVGLLGMFVLFPALAFLVAWLYGLSPSLAMGLVLLAASPSASTSTLFTYLARGDAALSLTLTAVSKLLPVVTIPVYVGLASRLFAAADPQVSVTFADISGRVVQMVLVPTVAGMVLRHHRPALADRLRPLVTRLAVAALTVLILLLVYREREALPGMLLAAGPAALTLCLVGMGGAYALGTLLRLSDPQRVAVTLEVGMQSGGTAIAIAAGLLAAPAMAVPAAVYSLLMYVTAGAFVYGRRDSARTFA